MEEELEVTPKSPAGAALALGIIGLVMAIMGGVMFGVIGGGIGFILGIIALVLGISAKNKTDRQKGNGGFVLGILSLVFGIIMCFSFFVVGSSIKIAAADRGLPLLSKHGGAFTYGVVGLIVSVGNEGDLEELKDELRSVSR